MKQLQNGTQNEPFENKHVIKSIKQECQIISSISTGVE